MSFVVGDIWLVQFSEPPEGGEQGFKRPAVIVSSNRINEMPIDVLIVVPSTTRRRQTKAGKIPDNLVEVLPSDTNGLVETSYFMSEQVRAVSKSHRLKKRLGRIAQQDLLRVKRALCLVLDLFPESI